MMWRKSVVSGLCRRLLDRGNDGMALVTVLMAILVLSLIAVGAFSQVRPELKAARIQVDTAGAQALIKLGFDTAVKKVATQGNLPEFVARATGMGPALFPNPRDDAQMETWTPCVPAPVASGQGYLCAEMLQGILLGNGARPYLARDGQDLYDQVAEIPVAVRWQVREGDPVRSVYGWIMVEYALDPDTGDLVWSSVWPYYNRNW